MSQGDVKSTKDRKEIAARLASEENPDKVLALAQELIKVLDERSMGAMDDVTPESKRRAARPH